MIKNFVNKMHTNQERKLKLPLFADDMMFYIDNPKESTKNIKTTMISARKQDIRSTHKN